MPTELLTPAEIAEAKALCEAATPGPWDAEGCGDIHMDGRRDGYQLIHSGSPRRLANPYLSLENAEFIAAARSLLPRAVATIEARDVEIERLIRRAEVYLAAIGVNDFAWDAPQVMESGVGLRDELDAARRRHGMPHARQDAELLRMLRMLSEMGAPVEEVAKSDD